MCSGSAGRAEGIASTRLSRSRKQTVLIGRQIASGGRHSLHLHRSAGEGEMPSTKLLRRPPTRLTPTVPTSRHCSRGRGCRRGCSAGTICTDLWPVCCIIERSDAPEMAAAVATELDVGDHYRRGVRLRSRIGNVLQELAIPQAILEWLGDPRLTNWTQP